MNQQTIAAAALAYAKRGWKPVPIHRKTKKPIDKGWQKRPYDPAQFNGNSQNVAIQLGAISGGLVDVDLNSRLAIGLSQEFLPATGAIFGHRSKPCSHQLYVSDLHTDEKRAAIQFKDKKTGATIVELRVGANDKAATVVVPPSMHVTGEMVEWTNDGMPTRVNGAALKRAVLKLAIACLLVPRYPGQGSRHEGALVLGGVLARAGWAEEDIRHLMEVVARSAGDDERHDRVTAATSAVNLKANGHDLPGLPRLAELWGKDCAETFGKWLPITPASGNSKGAGLEDAVALDFAEQHVNDLRFVAKSSQWVRWNATRWQPEDTLAAFDKSRKLCRVAGDSRAKVVAAVVTLARSDRRMAATADQWDGDPEKLNTPNQKGSA